MIRRGRRGGETCPLVCVILPFGGFRKGGENVLLLVGMCGWWVYTRFTRATPAVRREEERGDEGEGCIGMCVGVCEKEWVLVGEGAVYVFVVW